MLLPRGLPGLVCYRRLLGLLERAPGISAAAALAGPVSLAGNDGRHVVFGAGQVGRVLAALFAERASRSGSCRGAGQLAWVKGWTGGRRRGDRDAASDAAKGTTVIY
jgi:hypothetical protein